MVCIMISSIDHLKKNIDETKDMIDISKKQLNELDLPEFVQELELFSLNKRLNKLNNQIQEIEEVQDHVYFIYRSCSKLKIKVHCKIGELLKEEGRSQQWLADKIGAKRQQVNNWCSNKGSMPSIGYILKMQKVTGWSLEQMFEEIKKEE